MQINLNDLGYTDSAGKPLRVDGDYGPGTRFAIESFQRSSALLVTGLGDQATLTATRIALSPNPMDQIRISINDLAQRLNPNPQSRDVPFNLFDPQHADPATSKKYLKNAPQELETELRPLDAQVLSLNVRGNQVQALQQRLLVLGVTDSEGRQVTIDGHYGEKTRTAVENFQLWAGLPVTGKADRSTISSIDEHAKYAFSRQQAGHEKTAHISGNLIPNWHPKNPILDETVDSAIPSHQSEGSKKDALGTQEDQSTRKPHPDQAKLDDLRERIEQLHAQHGLSLTPQQADNAAASLLLNMQISGVKEAARVGFSVHADTQQVNPQGNLIVFAHYPLREYSATAAVPVHVATATPAETSLRELEDVKQQHAERALAWQQERERANAQEQLHGPGPLTVG